MTLTQLKSQCKSFGWHSVLSEVVVVCPIYAVAQITYPTALTLMNYQWAEASAFLKAPCPA